MEIPQEVIDKLVPEFTKGVQQGKWDQAVRDLEAGVATYKAALQQSAEELKSEENKLTDSINDTKSTRGKAELTKNIAERALNTDYPAMIKQLEAKNAQLEKRVSDLESLLKQKIGDIVSKTAGTGKALSGEADKQLRENAAAAKMYKTELEQVQAREQLIGKIQGVVQRWFSIYAAVRMVTNAIKSVISTVKELDATITEIAIVTKMDQSDLWGQMDQYTDLARKYASSISGVYKVSQLYYQQGLGKSDVMALTEQTLKMARISGLDYAEATDYMTNAVRSFKMEMTDAQRVVDTYSAIAASSATNVTELATAMSKTASSANAVGSSFENTTAMMAVMIEATRESAENIGSAMKSIISRYGELKENKTGIDSEGEEYSLNKVDTALQSVGLSIHDVNGEFRNFDDVIMELAEKWNTIDKNTQRYIATVMAGNRQQSRFLALVSSYDRLKELSAEAADSENASQLQFLKTLDSVDAKTQQLKTSLQSLYVDSGVEKLYKGILDIANNIVQTFTNMPTALGLPLPAIVKLGLSFTNLATIVTTAFGLLKSKLQANINALTSSSVNSVVAASNESIAATEAEATARIAAMEKYYKYRELREAGLTPLQISKLSFMHGTTTEIGGNTGTGTGGKTGAAGITKTQALSGLAASMLGMIVTTIASNMDEKTQEHRNVKGFTTIGGTALQGLGLGLTYGGTKGAIIGGIGGLLLGITQALNIFEETTQEKIANLDSAIQESSNKVIKSKAELKSLKDYKTQIQTLSKTKDYNSDDRERWIELNNELVTQYPELLDYIDEEGNKIADLGDAYDSLYNKKKQNYESDWLKNIQDIITAYSDMDYILKDERTNATNVLTKDRTSGFTRAILSSPITGASEADKATWAELELDHIDRLMTEAGKDLNKFKELIKRDYGMSYEELQAQWSSGKATHKEWRANQPIWYWFTGGKNYQIGEKQSEAMGNYLNSVVSNWDYNIQRADKQMTSILSEMVDYYGEEMDFSEFSVLKDQATAFLNTKWNEVKQTYSDPAEAMTVFMNNVTDYLTEFNTGLTDAGVYAQPKLLKEANKIFSGKGEYSQDTLQEIIDGTSKYAEFFSDEQKAVFKKYIDKNVEAAKNGLNEIFNTAIDEGTYTGEIPTDLISNFVTQLSDVPFKYWDSYLSSVSAIMASSNYIEDDKIKVIQSMMSLNNLIDKSGLSEKDKSSAYQLISTTDFTSLESLYDLQESLANLGINLDLTELVNMIIPNLATEFDRLSTKVVGQFKDFESALSSASKGMNIADAVKMANKLDIDLSDPRFKFSGGKYYFTDAEAIKSAYIDYNEQLYEELNEKQNEQAAVIAKTIDNNSDTTILDAVSTLPEESIPTVDELMSQYGIDKKTATQILNWYENYYDSYISALHNGDITSKTTFSNYVLDKITSSQENLQAAIDQYGEYAVNAALIQNGKITEFLNNLIGTPEDYAKIIRAKSVYGGMYHISWEDALAQANQAFDNVIAGNWDDLPDEVRPYLSELWNFLHDSTKNTFSSAINVIKGEGPQLVQVTEANRALLERLTGENLEDVTEVILDNIDLSTLKDEIRADGSLSKSDKSSLLKSIYDEEHPDLESAITGVLTEGQITYSAAESYLIATGEFTGDVEEDMRRLGFAYDSLTGTWQTTNQAAKHIGNQIARFEAQGNLTTEQLKRLNKLYAQEDNATDGNVKQEITSAFSTAFKNVDALTTEMVANLATATGTKYKDFITTYLKDNGDGTYKIDSAKLLTLLNEAKGNVSEATYNELLDEVASIQQDVLSLIENAGSYSTKGITSLSDMQKFTNEFNKGLDDAEQVSMDDLFDYSSDLQAFILNPQRLYKFIQRKRTELQTLGMTDEEINQYIEDYTANLTSANVDITSFLKSSDKNRNSKAWNTFRQQLKTWGTNKFFGQNPAESTLDAWMQTLISGGQEAVKLAKEIKGSELTDDEITSIYNNAVNEIKTAIDQVEAKEGEIIDAHAAKVLKRIYGEDAIEDLGNGKAIVKSLPEGGRTDAVVQAYTALYKEMQSHDEATLADLNSTFAKIVTAQEYEQSYPIEAISNAASMTYEQLGEILAQEQFTLEDVYSRMSEFGIEQLGAGKVRIADFTKFASKFGWDTNTEEYTSAFKEYNDNLIEYNKHIEDEIKGEFDSLIGAKVGDQINLTRFVSEFGEDKITEAIDGYGAVLKDGILTITETEQQCIVRLAKQLLTRARCLKPSSRLRWINLKSKIRWILLILINQ